MNRDEEHRPEVLADEPGLDLLQEGPATATATGATREVYSEETEDERGET